MPVITYTDKEALNVNSSVAAINKVQDIDMNSIKKGINQNSSYTSCTFSSNKYTCTLEITLQQYDLVKVFVPFSNQDSNSDSDVSISVDGGTNYYNIKDSTQTTTLKASTFNFKDSYLDLLYTGTAFIVVSPNVEAGSTVVFSRLTTNQSISNSSFATILYNDTAKSGLDFASINNGTITINVSGKYLLALNTIFDTNTTGGRYQDIFKGGVGYGVASTNGATGVRTALNSIYIADFTAGDTFTCRAYQTSGGALNLMTSSAIRILKL